MNVSRAAATIKQIVRDADLDLRQPVLGKSYVERIEGEIHPECMTAYDLRASIELLRQLADAIEARFTACTKRAREDA